MEFVIQPTAIPSSNYIAAMVTMNTITAANLTVIGLAFVASYSATSSMMNKSFNSNPADIGIEFVTSLAASCIFTATAAMYFAKLPILLFVMRTFGVHAWLRYTGYFLMVVTATCFFAAAMWTGVNLSRNSLSLAVDVVIFAMPLPFVAKLNLSLRKKMGVALVFLTSSFGVAASVASLYYQTSQAAETSSNITNAMLTTIIECCTFLMVSCAPALRLFWSKYVAKTALAARLGLGNSVIKGGSGSKGLSKLSREIGSGLHHSRSHHDASSKSSQTPIRTTSSHYIELDDHIPQTGVPAYTAADGEVWDKGSVYSAPQPVYTGQERRWSGPRV
ncbi:hypothetical protein B0H63DRAFT_445781 [Podospora didyma]|uniref:Rhodopsin domain-containing protein n=1 Tax=Podospora didyma TaxID=330526 RepID=A0AAE0NXS8_9PEZI|nr:hypothetical protein B0H63DRAFT_445781 [Podospora didyma]